MLVLLSGVATLFYTASIVMAGGRRGCRRARARWFNRMLHDIENHFIICGYGRIGGIIADEFRKQTCRTS